MVRGREECGGNVTEPEACVCGYSPDCGHCDFVWVESNENEGEMHLPSTVAESRILTGGEDRSIGAKISLSPMPAFMIS